MLLGLLEYSRRPSIHKGEDIRKAFDSLYNKLSNQLPEVEGAFGGLNMIRMSIQHMHAGWDFKRDRFIVKK